MTSEPDTDETHERLSRAYRKLDLQKTPEYLDRAVLQLAKRENRSAYRFAVPTWLKPMAAATAIAFALLIAVKLEPLVTTPEPGGGLQTSTGMPENSALPAPMRPQALTLKDADPWKREAMRKNSSFAAASPAAPQAAAATELASANLLPNSTAVCPDRVALVWRKCIDELQESGALEEAARQYEAFILEYPAKAENQTPNK